MTQTEETEETERMIHTYLYAVNRVLLLLLSFFIMKMKILTAVK